MYKFVMDNMRSTKYCKIFITPIPNIPKKVFKILIFDENCNIFVLTVYQNIVNCLNVQI